MKRLYCIIGILLILAAAFLSGALTHRRWYARNVTTSTDTVYVLKTVEIPAEAIPAPAVTAPAPDSIPSVTVPAAVAAYDEERDSLTIRPELRTWRDTLPSGIAYDISVSGVGVQLQHIGFSWPERQVTRTEVIHTPVQGWALSAVGGSSFSGFRKEDIAPFVGLELEYTKGIVSFGIAPGVQWERPLGASSHSPAFRIDGTLKIRICRF